MAWTFLFMYPWLHLSLPPLLNFPLCTNSTFAPTMMCNPWGLYSRYFLPRTLLSFCLWWTNLSPLRYHSSRKTALTPTSPPPPFSTSILTRLLLVIYTSHIWSPLIPSPISIDHSFLAIWRQGSYLIISVYPVLSSGLDTWRANGLEFKWGEKIKAKIFKSQTQLKQPLTTRPRFPCHYIGISNTDTPQNTFEGCKPTHFYAHVNRIDTSNTWSVLLITPCHRKLHAHVTECSCDHNFDVLSGKIKVDMGWRYRQGMNWMILGIVI